MCAIVDANVTFEVFGRKQTEAGTMFRRWLDSDRGTLVVGGRNLEELAHNGNFRRWFQEARRATGRVRQVDRASIETQEQRLRGTAGLKSDDGHVVALALASGARLLYSNDRALQDDFSNRRIIQRPKGRIYATQGAGGLTSEHRELLDAENLCSRSGTR